MKLIVAKVTEVLTLREKVKIDSIDDEILVLLSRPAA